MEPSFSNLLAVVAIAFAAPLLLGLVPRLVLPAIVLEIVAGILVGPDVLGLVEVDAAVEVLRVLGLAMLLFLAGLELDLRGLQGSQLRVALVGFAASFALAVAAGVALEAAGVVRSPLFVAIVLSSTSLGVVVPVLKDSGVVEGRFGQLVIAAASIADVATIVLLSLLFSERSSSTGAQAALLGGLVVLAGAVVVALRSAGRTMRIGDAVERLASTTAQIRVRGAFLLLVGFAAIAQEAGLEVILGAFVAGILLGALDADGTTRHPEFRVKLDAVGFGVLIPVFFVASGLTFDLDALTSSTVALVLVPVAFAALVVVRGVPALLYRGELRDQRLVLAAGALQAVSLPFIVASTAIGRELELLTPATSAGLIAGGLLSVLVLPPVALTLLRRVESAPHGAE
jgi:Kef-type K+ transport system membrane component KefB